MARPPQYDCNDVLARATRLFWQKGYRGVSVSDLVEATGLLPGSLYGRFGSKEGLFVACVEYYTEKADACRAGFEGGASPLGRLRAFFLTMARQAADDQAHLGCFLVNAAVECDVSAAPRIKQAVSAGMGRGEAWLSGQLRAACEAGELRPETPVEGLATCLVGSLLGFRVMSRADECVDRIVTAAATTLDSLLAEWVTGPVEARVSGAAVTGA